MKTLYFLVASLIFLNVNLSYAQYDCYEVIGTPAPVMTPKNYPTSTGNVYYSIAVVNDPPSITRNYVFETYGALYKQEGTTMLYLYGFHSINGWTALASSGTAGFYRTDILSSYPSTLSAGCPAPCSTELTAKQAECGGAEYVKNWNTETCTGECACAPDPVTNTAYCTSLGYSGLWEWHPELCKPICSPCGDFNEVDACPSGMVEFDNETCEPVCKDCRKVGFECIAKCGSKQEIESFNCTNNSKTGITSSCICRGDLFNPRPPPDPNIDDPTPDPTKNPDNNPDATNNPPDGDNPETNPEGDGNNDNALLDSIAENMKRNVKNTDRIGDILGTEMDILNATGKDIIDGIDEGNGYLEQIEDALHTDQADLLNAIGEGNEHLSDIRQNTADSKGFLETLKTDFQGFVSWMNFEKLEQADVDAYVTNFETELDTAWGEAETTANESIMESVAGTDPVDENDLDFITVPLLSMLPTEQTCSDLDLSYNEHTLIIDCDISLTIKEILSYFVYISTMLVISTLIFRQLRPTTHV